MLQDTRIRNFAALLLGLTAWGLIIYKAFFIPVTHDEVATMVHYLHFSTWEIMMYPDPWPNNHILNTLLAKYSMAVFGVEPWSARLPNVLSFLLYFFAAFQICRLLFAKETLPFLGALAVFLFNPFLLDFFSLCRGYGMSNALLLTAAMFSLQGFLHQRERALWLGLVFAMLAAYANFTALVFWCAVNGLLFLYFLNEFAYQRSTAALLKKVGIQLASALAFAGLIYTPIQKMQSTNQFEYWQTNSFFQDTILSLVESTRYGSVVLGLPSVYWAMLAMLAFFAAGAYLFYNWGKTSRRTVFRSSLLVAFSLLSLTVMADTLQTIILQTPNLTTRTALLYYPLFILLAVSVWQQLHPLWLRFSRIAGGIMIVMSLLHMNRTVQFGRVREWWYDANTFQVQEILRQAAGDEQVTLATNWHFYRSFDFYVQAGKTPWIDLQADRKDIDTSAEAQFYYIFDSDLEKLQDRYEVVRKFDGGSRLLLRKKDENSRRNISD